MKEFVPDKIILLCPGILLGGTIGQILIETKRYGLTNKDKFINLQKESPFLL